jgi:hypothetical protein
MEYWKTLPLFALLAVLAVIAVALKRRFEPRYPQGALPYFSKRFLLSKGEAAFYHALRAAVPPGLAIAPKVRVSDVIGCDGAAWKQGFGGRISQKHVDFVLVSAQSTEIVLIIELDDKTHRRRDRSERDEFLDRAFAAADISVMHVPAAAHYDVAKLRSLIAEQLTPIDAR